MFLFTPKPRIHTVIIENSSVLTGNTLTVEKTWQPRHTAGNLDTTLSRAIVSGDDLIDVTLTQYIHAHGASTPSQQPLRRFAFDQRMGASGNLWHHGSSYRLTIKGKPEAILHTCDLSDNERESILLQLQALAATGLYVIALASGDLSRPVKNIADVPTDEKLSFDGFICLGVTIPGSTRHIIRRALAKNTSIYLVTGQHPATAYHIAQQLGIASQPQQVYDSQHLTVASPLELQTIVASTKIFARTTTDQHDALIAAIKHNDHTATTVHSLDQLTHLIGK